MEKPFCRSPAEADDIAAACQTQNVKLAVAHRNRYHPVLPTIAQLIKAGELGKVLEIRGRGKGDRRGGSEDLWVLGSHVLNLVHYFGGKATSCSAMIYRQGIPITKSDIVAGNEGLGPLAGDEVRARFRLASGLTAYFDSMANDGTESQAFGLQIIGSKGVIDFKIDREPLARICRGNPFELLPKAWVPIASTGIGTAESDPTIAARVANHQVAAEDLIASIHLDRQPQCGLADAVQTVEMISAVFESHRLGGQNVSLPLEDRRHPFARW
jgi:predicted dehydrogenase